MKSKIPGGNSAGDFFMDSVEPHIQIWYDGSVERMLIAKEGNSMKDLTQGKILKTILFFSIPILIGNLFQQLYNIVDTVIVGNILGVSQLAAVGATGSLSFLIVGFVNGMTNGFSLLVSRDFGANNFVQMKRYIAGAVLLGTGIGIVMTVLSLLFLHPMLRLIRIPSDILSSSYNYIFVIFAGILITMFYNLAASILRAVGDSKTPLYFLMIASVLNILLDVLFLKYWGFGVEGAAYATLISQAVSVILCFLFIFRKYSQMIPSWSDFLLSIKEIKNLLAVGFSMAFQSCFVAIGSVAMTAGANGLGTIVVASFTAANRINQMTMLPLITIGTACATFASQNLGAGKILRVKVGIRKALILSFAWTIFSILVIYLFDHALISLLVSKQDTAAPEVIRLASRYLRFNLPFYFPLAVLFVYRSALQGIGQNFAPVFSGCIELVCKTAIGLGLSGLLGFDAVIIAEPITWVLCAILLYITFYTSRKMRALSDQSQGKMNPDQEVRIPSK